MSILSLIGEIGYEDTPRENQMEILNEIEGIADLNGQITIALSQVYQSDIG